MTYGVVLKIKRFADGLSRAEILDLFDMLDDVQCYPIEIAGSDDCIFAMGFITPAAAKVFKYDYSDSGLNNYISYILDEMARTGNSIDELSEGLINSELNSELNDEVQQNVQQNVQQYEFQGVHIWLG